MEWLEKENGVTMISVLEKIVKLHDSVHTYANGWFTLPSQDNTPIKVVDP